MQKKLLHLIVYLFFCSVSSFPQSLQVETYTPANGLLDTRVIKIFQDNRGLLYFLTWEGISIYDGQRFKNITEYEGEGLGLVNDMIQWKKDTCYVFTFQKGIFKLINGRLIKDTALNAINEPNRVLQINSNSWLIFANTGLFSWNGKSVQPYVTQKSNNRKITGDKAFLNGHHVIFSSNHGTVLYCLDLNSGIISDSISRRNLLLVANDPQSNIYVSIDGKWRQLNNEALQSGQLKTQPFYFERTIPAGWNVNYLFFTEKKIWIKDITRGLLIMDAKTGSQEKYPLFKDIASDEILLFGDKENNYWVSSFNKQVQKCFYTRMKHLLPDISTGINNLLTDETGRAIASNGENVYFLLPSNTTSVKTGGQKGVNSFYWQNRSWVFINNSLIKSDKGDLIDLSKTTNPDTSFFNSFRFTVDKDGRLLISGNSLYVIEKNLTVYSTPLKYFTDNIVVDDNNHYWAITRTSNIDEYVFSGNSINHVYSYKPAIIAPRFALHWNADTFCIGTRYKGIVWLKVTKDGTTIIGNQYTNNGLSNNFVTGLVKKNNNQLIASSGFGLDEITMQNGDTTVENLAAANNLFLPFSFLAKSNIGDIYARSDDGQLWQVIDAPITVTSFIPEAWFNEISVNGILVNDSSKKFNYNQNNFRFSVAAPCLINSRSLRFSFLLQGGSNTWQQQSADNFYSINNLAPGNYTLTVIVQYPGKIYPDKKIVYSFTIKSPLWKRRWFIALLVLLTGLLLWAIIRNYYRRKLAIQKAEAEKNQAVEKERNRISRDMHDDLGSGLTKIAIMSEVAKKQLPEPLKAKEQLEKISESSRELVDNLQDIIWVLNPKNDTLDSLAAYIREYALKYFEPLAVKVIFSYPEQFSTKHLSEEKRRNVFLTVKESLTNIAKHAWCNKVLISIHESRNQFELKIRDDGKGFEPEKVRLFANGLKNMKNRIQNAGGTYIIESGPGKGTLTTIQMAV